MQGTPNNLIRIFECLTFGLFAKLVSGNSCYVKISSQSQQQKLLGKVAHKLAQ